MVNGSALHGHHGRLGVCVSFNYLSCHPATEERIQRAVLRFADAGDASIFEEKFEIVSLVGTLSINGVHLHIALANAKGTTKAGHLLPGCEIYTTAEIIIGEATDLLFAREPDAQTGFRELVIRPRPKSEY